MKINIKNNSLFHHPLHVYFAVLFLFLFLMGKTCLGIIMVDISESLEEIKFTTTTHAPISAKKSIRIVTFETDTQRILQVSYLLLLTEEPQYFELDSCLVEYGNGELKITPTPKYNACFRSSGKINALDVRNLSDWDKTREAYSFVCQGIDFPNHDINTLRDKLKHYNLE